MILQYLSKTDAGMVETIRDNVVTINEFDEKVEVMFYDKNENYTIEFPVPHPQIENMWVLNDEFKTLKRLI